MIVKRKWTKEECKLTLATAAAVNSSTMFGSLRMTSMVPSEEGCALWGKG